MPDHPTSESRRSELLRTSFLRRLPREAAQSLLADAVAATVPAGTVTYREADDPRFSLVMRGLFRVFMTSPDGRQVTVRYAGPGAVLGIMAFAGGPSPVNVQAVTDAEVFRMDIRKLRVLARADAGIAWAVAELVTDLLYGVLEGFAATTFGTIRQLIARHLLDIAAAEQQQGKLLAAPVSHQELADAVGTVREVVSRTLVRLRTEGLVRPTAQGITILDAEGLHAIAWSRARNRTRPFRLAGPKSLTGEVP